jgi:hypothetical protein
MSLNLAGPIRDALLGNAQIAAFPGEWGNEPAIATRRPVPANYPPRIILINPDAAVGDFDGLTSDRPIIVKDIAIYGDQPKDYRDVEACGYQVRDLFHRQRFSIVPVGFQVVDIVASGPFPAPVDDEKTVGRIVSLTIRLRRIQP